MQRRSTLDRLLFGYAVVAAMLSLSAVGHGQALAARHLPWDIESSSSQPTDNAKNRPRVPLTRRKTFDKLLLPPLKKGMVWTYKGHVQVTDAVNKDITWRQEITEVVTYKNVTAAVLKGHPRDLWFYEEGRKPGRYLWVCVNNKKLYELEGDRVDSVLKLIRAKSDITKELTGDDLIVDLPLNLQNCFGSQNLTQAPLFCWKVDQVSFADLKKVKLPSLLATELRRAYSYSMIYRANTDHTVVHFVRGLGFVDYAGSHHGTLCDFELHLQELSYPR